MSTLHAEYGYTSYVYLFNFAETEVGAQRDLRVIIAENIGIEIENNNELCIVLYMCICTCIMYCNRYIIISLQHHNMLSLFINS